MAEVPSHNRAKSSTAGQNGKKEVSLFHGRRLDAATPPKAIEIERSGSMVSLEKAAPRLKASHKPHERQSYTCHFRVKRQSNERK